MNAAIGLLFGLLGFSVLVFAGVAAYLAGARRKETVTVEDPSPTYREPALLQERRDVSVMQRIREMPRSVAVLIVALAALFSALIAVRIDPALLSDAYRAVAPRYEEVPAGHRGVIVDRHGGFPLRVPLEPGRHLVLSDERMELVDCETDAPREFETWTKTTDGLDIGLRFSGQVRFSCSDELVWRVVQERAILDESESSYGAWEFYITPAVSNAFQDLIDGRSSGSVYLDRDEIIAAVTRRIDSLQQQAVVDIASIELVLPKGLSDNGQPDRPAIVQFDFPSLEGWSTTLNEYRDEIVYTRHRPGVTIRVMTWPEAEGSPEHLVGSYAAGRSDRVRSGSDSPPVTDAAVESSDVAWFISIDRRDGHFITTVIHGMRSRSPGVNLLFIGTCEGTSDCGYTALADLAYRIRPRVD